MTSGGLNIDLTRKCFYVKVVDLSTAYPMAVAVCHSDVWFLISEGGPKRPPAKNRTFQSPPGIGLTFFL